MSVSSYNSTNNSIGVVLQPPAPPIGSTTSTTATCHLLTNKDIKKKFLKTFDLSQIAEDPMDIYLDTLGLWKKRIARDGSCLFRAVAEQIYPCQLHHERVRQECVKYMSDNRDTFSKYIVSVSFDEYLEAMKNPFEYGGQLEIAAMSKLYKRDFIIYHHPDQTGVDVTQNGYEKNIFLCYSYNNHFDAIFTKSHRDNLALIQSLVYEILYEKVFGSGEQVSVARRLLRKSDTIYPKEYMNLRNLNEFDELDIEEEDEEEEEDQEDEVAKDQEETNQKIDENNNENDTNLDSTSKSDETNTKSNKLETSIQEKIAQNQKMPLPYKVAKSLDPVIYRNTAFDAWLAAKKEYEESLNQKALSSLHPGDKCFVRLNNNFMDKWNLAYLHSIQHDLANVFVVELNENHCVSLENLKPFTNDVTLLNQSNSGYYHHYYGTSYPPFSNHQSTNSSSVNHLNNVKNVQKLVQSMNPQFSKIFLSTENKRRTNLKKKQFSIKKSFSFHAISAELPTLIEVEEQMEDSYGQNSHQYYLGDQSNPAFSNFNLAPTNFSLGYQPYMQHPNHHIRPTPQIPHSQTYYSQPNQYDSNKFNSSNSKMTSSASASNLSFSNGVVNKSGSQLTTSQSANVINSNKNNTGLLMPTTNITNQNNMKNNRRNQRYNQNQQQHSSFDATKQHQTPHWQTNSFFNTPPTQQQMNTYIPAPPNHTMPPPPPPPPLMNLPGNMPFTNQSSFGSNMSLPPLVNQSGYIPPPPPLPQMGPIQSIGSSSMLPPPPPHPSQFMHPPQLQPPTQQTSSNSNRNFFNSNSNYMIGLPPPPPPPAVQPSNSYNTHLMNGDSSSYYFSNSNNNCNLLFPNNTPVNYSYSSNNSKFQNNQRDKNKFDMYDTNSFQATTNTNNYLLMPAPCNKNLKSSSSSSSSSTQTNKSSTTKQNDSLNTSLFDSNLTTSNLNGLPRSHSYHSGVSTQSYDLSQTNNSNVYVDVYQTQTNSVANHQENLSVVNSTTTNTTTTTGNTNQTSSASSSCLNDLNNLINSNTSYPGGHSSLINSTTNTSNANNSTNNLDNSNLMYGSNNFQNYELQYPRFDNNLTSSASLNDDSFLINSNDRTQMNLWNKNTTSTNGNKLMSNKQNGFNDMYSANGVTSVFPSQMPPPPVPTTDKTNQFCYSNCLVVNIDGPINFNATHSLLDDGSDLPFNDMNTIRFFYNVGIEYYRLNLAAPYNQQNSYSTPCYAPPPPPPPQMSIPLMPSSTSMPTLATTSSSIPVNNTNTSSVTNTTNTTSLGSLTTNQLGLTNSMANSTKPIKSDTPIDSNNNYINSQTASTSSATTSNKNLTKSSSNRRY